MTAERPPTNEHDVEITRIKALARVVVTAMTVIGAMIAALARAWS